MTVIRNKDQELWSRWKANKSPANLEALMAQVMPLIRNETQRWNRVVPQLILEAHAKELALKAFETYNPNRDVLLSTHVVNNLKPLSRLSYDSQSTLSVPEAQRITFNQVQNTYAHLEDELGHKPTVHHVADRLGLPVAEVHKVMHNVARSELTESGDGPVFQLHDSDDDLIHLAYYDLTPLQQKIFVMRTGYTPSGITNPMLIKDGEGIMKDLGITQGQLSYQLTQIAKVLEKADKLKR